MASKGDEPHSPSAATGCRFGMVWYNYHSAGTQQFIFWREERALVPRIVRPMRKDASDGQRPSVEQKSRCLWARTSGDHADIDLDAAGYVILNRKGISVSADWRTLKPWLIPVELDDGRNGATGRGMAVFVHGQDSGPFAEAGVAAGLELCLKADTADAGHVCPIVSVPLAQYQTDLAATQLAWVIDPS